MATAKLFQDLSRPDFETLLQENEQVLVSFSSLTLKNLAPFNTIFSTSATNLSTPFVTINCDTEPSLCASHDINSYPTIRLLSRTQNQETSKMRYRGQRTVKAITSFIKKRELPVLSHLQVSDMNFRRIDSIVFIAMLAPEDTHHLSIFSSAAQKHHFQFAFGYTTDASIPDQEKVQTPSILCYRNDDGENFILSGPFTQRDVDKFLAAGSTSVIKTFREKNVETFMQRDKLTAYIFLRNPDESEVSRDLRLVAKKYDRVVTFAVVDLSRYAEMPRNFGIQVRGDEALVVHAPGNDQIFYFQQGKKIGGKEVENMLVTILQGKASEGQVFGEGAEDIHARGGDEGEHDEL